MTLPTRHGNTTRAAHLPLLLLLATGLALPVVGCRRKGAKAFNQGQGHLKKKHYAKAIVSFKKAVEQNPDFGEAHYNLGAARYQLAARKLNELVKKRGSGALKSALEATGSNKPVTPGIHPPRQKALQAVLVKELRLLPADSADPIVTLIRQALSAKLKALDLFEKGKFVVVGKSSTRRAMLGKLKRIVRLRGILRKEGEKDRGLWLLAVARPALLTEQATKKSRPHPPKEPKP